MLLFSCPLNTYGGELNGKKASGTGIGYGKRSDFTRCLTVSPSSSSYNIRSFWDENQKNKKGPGFALSRDVSLHSFRESLSINTFLSNPWRFQLQANIIMRSQSTNGVLLSTVSDKKQQLSIRRWPLTLRIRIQGQAVTSIPNSNHSLRSNIFQSLRFWAMDNPSQRDSYLLVPHYLFRNIGSRSRQIQRS